jgi:hypothetical protein
MGEDRHARQPPIEYLLDPAGRDFDTRLSYLVTR